MRVGRVEAAERGKELPTFGLQAVWQGSGLAERLLHLDRGFIVIVEFEDDVGESFEIRVHRSIQCQFDVAGVESALLRVVITHFE